MRRVIVTTIAIVLLSNLSRGADLEFKNVSPPNLRERAAVYFKTVQRQKQLQDLGVSADFSGINSQDGTFIWNFKSLGEIQDIEKVDLELKKMVEDMLGQSFDNQKAINITGLKFDIRPMDIPEPGDSLFVYPQGLSLPPKDLFASLGHCPGFSVPMTPEYCYDLAYACWIRGNYADAIVLTRFGLAKRNDARLQLLLGVSLLGSDQPTIAEQVAEDYRDALADRQTYGMSNANERVNGPLRVRFNAVVKHQAMNSADK